MDQKRARLGLFRMGKGLETFYVFHSKVVFFWRVVCIYLLGCFHLVVPAVLGSTNVNFYICLQLCVNSPKVNRLKIFLATDSCVDDFCSPWSECIILSVLFKAFCWLSMLFGFAVCFQSQFALSLSFSRVPSLLVYFIFTYLS